jgi:serine/threonine protein kinase
MENTNILERNENFNLFEWYYKEDFRWNVIHHNESQQRTTYRGEEKFLGNAHAIMKQIKLKEENYKTLLKEAFFLSCLKNNRYFAEIIDLFTSDNCDYIYIILREEGTDLKNFISSKTNYNTKIANISRFIIFQAVCGLKILHEKGFSHNDIKPSNITISGTAKVKLCDLGSTDKTGTIRGSGTDGYLSPQALLGLTRNRKDDMYAIGIVFLELLKWEIETFKVNAVTNEEKLRLILNKYYDLKVPNKNWNEGINYNIIYNSIRRGDYDNFEYRLKSDIFNNNEEESNKELIKNLLEINPSRRMNAQKVINLQMFKDLNFRFEEENSEMKFKENDYNNYMYFPNGYKANIFKRHIEDIREKFIGKTLFEINRLEEKI